MSNYTVLALYILEKFKEALKGLRHRQPSSLQLIRR